MLCCNKSSPPAGGGPGSQKTILHEEQWKMPALPALLLSIHFLFLLLTMAPHSFSQAPAMSAVKMGKLAVLSFTFYFPSYLLLSLSFLSFFLLTVLTLTSFFFLIFPCEVRSFSFFVSQVNSLCASHSMLFLNSLTCRHSFSICLLLYLKTVWMSAFLSR